MTYSDYLNYKCRDHSTWISENNSTIYRLQHELDEILQYKEEGWEFEVECMTKRLEELERENESMQSELDDIGQ